TQRLTGPEADDEEERDEAAPAPYDWGVRKTATAKGAWLLDTPDERADAPAEDAGPAATPAAPAASGGARSFLVRKAGDEVQRFQPVLKALAAKGVIAKEDVEGAPAAPEGGSDDDVVSVESFRDDRPRDVD